MKVLFTKAPANSSSEDVNCTPEMRALARTLEKISTPNKIPTMRDVSIIRAPGGITSLSEVSTWYLYACCIVWFGSSFHEPWHISELTTNPFNQFLCSTTHICRCHGRKSIPIPKTKKHFWGEDIHCWNHNAVYKSSIQNARITNPVEPMAAVVFFVASKASILLGILGLIPTISTIPPALPLIGTYIFITRSRYCTEQS